MYKQTSSNYFAVVFMGNSLISDHHRTDFLTLFPAHSGTVLMRANNPGKWMIGCRIDTHREGGMFTSYFVNSTCGKRIDQQQLDGKVRRYFIAAEETVWNYGPTGYNAYDGESLNKTGRSVFIIYILHCSTFTIVLKETPYFSAYMPRAYLSS